MATREILFYSIDPFGLFSQTVGGTAAWTGGNTPTNSGTITDNQAGVDGDSFDEVGESATIDANVGGTTSTGETAYADEVWTLRDTVTGQTFQVVSLRIDSGPSTGWYTLSEIPLVDGRTYETLFFDTTPDASAGEAAFTYEDYVEFAASGVVQGTAGDDVIDASYTGDPDGDLVDAPDTLTARQFNWTDYADETNLEAGVTQNTGGINLQVSYSDANAADEFSAESSGGADAIYVAAGEPFSTISAGYLFAGGAPEDTTLTFDFSSVSGSGFENEVENVSFRISDIDGLNDGTNFFQDIVTVQAFDADNNPVTVNITGGSNHTVDPVTGTITGNLTNFSPSSIEASALIEIAGPVSQIVVTYDNGGTTQQAIYFSDIHFDAVTAVSKDDVIEAGAGNDIITGGEGADTVLAGSGNDTINAGSGDQVSGEEGDDTIIIDTANLNGGTITVDGGAEGASDSDTLNFNGQLQYGSLVLNNDPDDTGAFSGSATLLDGTVVTFDNIENVLCFTSGMALETPNGPRLIEDLHPGDLVLTRDNGPQVVRWHGMRRVMAGRKTAPIEIAPGVFGNERAVMVSPQHRILSTGYLAQLYFGQEEVLVAAKSLVNGSSIIQRPPGPVTYHHLLFDAHEILTCDGVESESYHPGSYGLPGLADQCREELFSLFPNLRSDPESFGPAARYSVKASQGHVLAA